MLIRKLKKLRNIRFKEKHNQIQEVALDGSLKGIAYKEGVVILLKDGFACLRF
jgi:hypothetical protein